MNLDWTAGHICINCFNWQGQDQFEWRPAAVTEKVSAQSVAKKPVQSKPSFADFSFDWGKTETPVTTSQSNPSATAATVPSKKSKPVETVQFGKGMAGFSFGSPSSSLQFNFSGVKTVPKQVNILSYF